MAASVVVVKLYEQSPARAAGMSEDMVIVALDGQTVRLRDEFFDFVRARKPGDEVQVGVLEAGKKTPREICVRLEGL